MQLPIIKVILCLVVVKLLTLCYAAGKMNVDNADCYNKSCAYCQCIVGCYNVSGDKMITVVKRSQGYKEKTQKIVVTTNAPIFKNYQACNISWERSNYSRFNDTWESFSPVDYELSAYHINETIILNIINSSTLFERLPGTLIKLRIQCERESNCVILKIESAGENLKLSTSSSPKLTLPSVGKDVKMAWKLYIVPNVISLCLVIAALVVVWYRRRRKRSARSKNSNTENPVTEENTSPVVQELSEYAIASNDSQPAPMQPQHQSIPDRDHEYQNDCKSGVQPKTPEYELPQSHKCEYPEQLPNDQYDYPDVRMVDGGSSPLVRPLVSTTESENSGYTSLINGQISKEASATGRKDQADRLLYVDVMDGDYTPLVRQPLKDNEAPCYQPLVKNGRKTSEEASATERNDEGNGFTDDVMNMNGDYTPLTRPPLKDNENEVPRYEPLLNNGQGSEEIKKPMQRGREKIN